MPLPEEPSTFARQIVITRGQFSGASGSAAAHLSRPDAIRIELTKDALSQYGMTVRNLQTLELLHYLKKELTK